MKKRIPLLLLLFIILPTLLAHQGLESVPLAPRTAHAQDQVTELAREKFIEGVKAFDARRYEEARTLFLQAYALKRHPAVLLNLGQSELKAGYVVDGGNHLQQFLREHRTATEDQKKAAKKGIQEAQQRAAFAVFIVDRDGATISIDGKPVEGTTPLLDPVFLKPGPHKAVAKLGSRVSSADFTAQQGTATPVEITLGGAPPPPPPPPPPPTATATAPPTATPTILTPYPPPTETTTLPPDATTTAPPPPPPPPPPTTGRERFDRWYVKKPLAWVGTGIAGLGLIGAIAFGAAAADASASADTVSDSILAQAKDPTVNPPGACSSAYPGCLDSSWYTGGNKVTGDPQPCGEFDEPSTSHPYYRQACDTLRDNIDIYDVDIALMATSIVLMGVAIGGTVVYYLLDSKTSAESETVYNGPRIIAAGPILTEDQKGFGLIGTF